jgi:hypothetical protein
MLSSSNGRVRLKVKTRIVLQHTCPVPSGAGSLVTADVPKEQDTGAPIRTTATQLSLSGPRRPGLMSAAHSGKFARINFTKTSFAAAGPEHERSECGGTERCCVLLHSAPGPCAR